MKPYFERGGITIYHGDCLEVMADFEPVDHVITDPPYEAQAHTQGRRVLQGTASARAGGFGVRAAPLSFMPITEHVRSETAHLIGAIARRWVLTFCQIEAAPRWREEYEDAHLRYMRTCIWVKPDGVPQMSGDRPGMGYETLLAMHPHGRSRWNGGGKHGVFTHGTASTRVEAHEHQTVKPIALMRELVALFTDPNELILDPFMGSGSTLKAAHDLGRRAIGIELEEKYCEIAARRLDQQVMAL